jgi:hypothetical protein
MIANVRHSSHVGDLAPLSRMNSYKTEPATKKRIPAHSQGGASRTAIRMAKNVDPQMT